MGPVRQGADQLTKDLLSLFSKVPESFKKQYQVRDGDTERLSVSLGLPMGSGLKMAYTKIPMDWRHCWIPLFLDKYMFLIEIDVS